MLLLTGNASGQTSKYKLDAESKDLVCATEKEILVCNALHIGDFTFNINGEQHKSLKLINKTGKYIQIRNVSVHPLKKDSWGEYCLSIRDWLTRQNDPGFGEVGCVVKKPEEGVFESLGWDNGSDGLTIAPDQSAYVGGYVHAQFGNDHRKFIELSVVDGVKGYMSLRQPKIDVSIRCNGNNQTTQWSPWPNTTGQDIKISGATIYAVSPGKKSVQEGCLYVMSADGKTQKWKYCASLNIQGRVHFPEVVVAPDEYIAAQASNTCVSGGLWDWAAYIYAKVQ